MLGYAYGTPRQTLDIEHEIGRDAATILMEIARSDRHRSALTELEAWRRKRLAAVTVEPL